MKMKKGNIVWNYLCLNRTRKTEARKTITVSFGFNNDFIIPLYVELEILRATFIQELQVNFFLVSIFMEEKYM